MGFVAGITVALIFLLFIAYRQAKYDATEETKTMVGLNQGHQIWCTDGLEKSGHCSCKHAPSFLTLHDIEKRHETIRHLATTEAK